MEFGRRIVDEGPHGRGQAGPPLRGRLGDMVDPDETRARVEEPAAGEIVKGRLDYKESRCDYPPFGRAKVRLKKEIISLGEPAPPADGCRAAEGRVPRPAFGRTFPHRPWRLRFEASSSIALCGLIGS